VVSKSWFEDIRVHIPAGQNKPTHLNIGGLFRDERTDEITGAVVCQPKPYPLLEALPELHELSQRYKFTISIGDQVKEPYQVADDYRARLAALVARFKSIAVTTGNCEVRLTPTDETYDIVRATVKRILRENFPTLTPAQREARLR
jgi:hypothetical protein